MYAFRMSMAAFFCPGVSWLSFLLSSSSATWDADETESRISTTTHCLETRCHHPFSRLLFQLHFSQNSQSFQQCFQIFFRRCNRRDAIVFYQEVKDIRRNKCRQGGAKADILNAQIQQRQQNAHGLLLVP